MHTGGVRGRKQSFTIDATRSLDPDDPDGLTASSINYEWFCMFAETGEPCFVDPEAEDEVAAVSGLREMTRDQQRGVSYYIPPHVSPYSQPRS